MKNDPIAASPAWRWPALPIRMDAIATDCAHASITSGRPTYSQRLT
jgi:hypothetical protein